MRQLILILMIMCGGVSASAQLKMADVFRTMPDSLALLLTHNDRMDLLDFAESKMTAKVTNRLDEKSTLDTISNDYLHLTLTAISSLEMKLLPLSDTLQAVAVVKTVAGPAKDSVLKLYAADWSSELDAAQHVTPPALDAYWQKPVEEMSAEQQEVARQFDPVLIEITLSPDRPVFIFQRSAGMLPKADQSTAKELLKPVEVTWQK